MKITAFNYIKGSLQEKSIVPIENSLSWCLIGRHPNCDFILNSPEVSRVHGIILYQEKAYYYIDLASTDGSRINNQALIVNQIFPLQFGDIIRIGDFFVLFESEEINLESNDQFFVNQETTITPTEKLPYQQQELIVKCSQIIQETDDVKTFRLIAEPPILFNDVSFNYKPGQFVMLNLEINGQQIKRPYSISSTPSRPYNLEITVKRISDGLVSNWLQDNFQIGNKIKISPPMGDFNYFDNSQKKLLFISAGSGITPLMSMSRWLCDTTPDFSVIFIYSARTQKDIIFREELEFMALRYTNFQLAITLTREEFNSTWSGYKGRLNEKMLLEIAPDFQQRIAYVCGSEDFLKSLHTMLQELNFPMHNYHQENFGSFKIDRPVVIPSQPSQENTVVVFTKSKQQVICHADETILKAAHREAIKLPYGCQMGVCGQCKLRKISGEVNYEQDFGCEEDYVLTCVAKANGSVVIEG
ncbi:MAG: FHA domain-containing protein [Richelia sp. RM2_1_2]|nr:FHA domain-containing protein [Richelia sp. RM1_1_1]NJO26130.1 FHA domain-containing protein [Richelia sp. SL_2_1]NJO58842.1 FHA domain-containing protein [Richelia sp. RM2_1_2]